jgi:hypothetical protein
VVYLSELGPPGAVKTPPPPKKKDSIKVCNDEFLDYNRVTEYVFPFVL